VRILLSRRTAPTSFSYLLIAERGEGGKPLKLVFGFPFLESDSVAAQYQEIGSVGVTLHLLPRFAEIAQLKGMWLIVEL
jgi:hypothetical protein